MLVVAVLTCCFSPFLLNQDQDNVYSVTAMTVTALNRRRWSIQMNSRAGDLVFAIVFACFRIYINC